MFRRSPNSSAICRPIVASDALGAHVPMALLRILMNVDSLIGVFDQALRTLSGCVRSSRPSPALAPEGVSDPRQIRHVVALMRVNHSGEVCAQALYQAQSLFSKSPRLAQVLRAAAEEEGDHLKWTADRIEELGGRRSLLDPVWYVGAFAVGALAAKSGDARNLGFLQETERQVVAHLRRHLDRLPECDERTRQVLQQMALDEGDHADLAKRMGAESLPLFARGVMKVSASVMTATAYRI